MSSNEESPASASSFPQMPVFNSVFSDSAAKYSLSEHSNSGAKSTEEHSFDHSSHLRDGEDVELDMEMEKTFSVSVQKKRKRLADIL